jgi:Flp pilus assembly protein TadD
MGGTAPDDVAATMQAAQAYLSFGREAQAAGAYEKALKLAPSNPMVLNNMAWLVQKTDPKRALELAEKAGWRRTCVRDDRPAARRDPPAARR